MKKLPEKPLSREVQDIRHMAAIIASGIMSVPNRSTVDAIADYSVSCAILISNRVTELLGNNG